MAKTLPQIKQYIKSQEWGKAFKKNLKSYLKCTLDTYLKERILRLNSIILEAFIWERTSQGVKYWADVETEYLKWYNDENDN